MSAAILTDMKNVKTKVLFLFLFSLSAVKGYSQYNWKLSKDKDGIKVYQSEKENSDFKSIKVECVLQGTYAKLIAALTDVSRQKEWVYKSKLSYMLKKNSPYDFYYYTETSIPWPMSNRDAVVHMIIAQDSLHRFLKITATGVPGYIPEKSAKVRVPKLLITWYVTMPSSTSISIVYTFETAPGGSIPAWLVNMFADKGPYETFKKLSEILKK
jgi:START domain